MEKVGSDLIRAKIVETITALVEPVLDGLELELVEVQFRREPVGWVLRLIIDSENGVTIDDCATVSREVGHLLEVEDPIEQSYNLEVSSPGLDRPLKTAKDFIRCKGQKAKVTLSEPLEGLQHFTGMIEGFEGEKLLLNTDTGLVQIPYGLIAKAKLVIEF